MKIFKTQKAYGTEAGEINERNTKAEQTSWEKRGVGVGGGGGGWGESRAHIGILSASVVDHSNQTTGLSFPIHVFSKQS